LKKKSSQNSYYKAAIVIALLNLFVVLFAKYSINGLSLSVFNIVYMGNLLNIILSLVLIIGLIIQLLNVNNSIIKYGLAVLSISSIYFICSFSFLFIGYDNIYFGSKPILNYPPQKMILGVLAIGSLLSQAYLTIFVWGKLIYKGKYLFIKSFTFLMFLSFIGLTFIAIFISTTNDNSITVSKNHYKYAMVPGAAVWNKNKPSPLFKGRIITALNLFQVKKVDKIQLTGGNAPGEISEAKAAYKFLIKKGVNKSFLLAEENTRTTAEQIKFVKQNLLRFSTDQKILIISDSFHIARIKEMCRFFNVNADTYSSKFPVSNQKFFYYTFRESVGLLLFWFFAI